jgi:hypothetical protein
LLASVDELDDVWRGTSWLHPAEEWWQRGIRVLNARSARELGRLLDWDPGLGETEHRLRVAYETGDTMAGYRLARLIEERGSLLDRGDFAKSEGWLNEADNLMDSVSGQTRPAAMALYRSSTAGGSPAGGSGASCSRDRCRSALTPTPSVLTAGRSPTANGGTASEDGRWRRFSSGANWSGSTRVATSRRHSRSACSNSNRTAARRRLSSRA